MINFILTEEGFDSIENPESIVTLVLGILVTVIGAVIQIIKKKTKKPESVDKNLNKAGGILKAFTKAMTDMIKSSTDKKDIDNKKVDAKKGT